MMKSKYLSVLLILIIISSSFASAYSDDERDNLYEIESITELENLLKGVEVQEDTKLVKGINKHIERLIWKAMIDFW